ncbi:MAG: Ca-activated chloride channel family protein [Flavobacteriaceae bacterium]
MLSWQWPWLVLVCPLPLLVRYWLPALKTQDTAVKVPFYDKLDQAHADQAASTRINVQSMLAIALWLCLIITVMRPVWYGEPQPVSTSGRDLMLAVDLSDSMKADDMLVDGKYITRINALKQIVGDFIQRRAGDRIGLIVFGQRSYLITPLTFDHRSVSTQLEEALPGFAGSSTSIGDAMGLAISTLRNRPSGSRVLVLLTDGTNTSGSEPLDALKIAAEADIRIYTVGLGATEKKIVDFAGRKRTINPSRDLDVTTLIKIAEVTGGQFFRAHNPAELEEIYATIDALEPIPETTTARPQYSLYHWPLALSLLLALVLLVTGRPQL